MLLRLLLLGYDIFCSSSALWAFFVSHSAARQKTIRRQTGQNESSEGGEAGVVGASSAKHALPFGARAALARTDSARPVLWAVHPCGAKWGIGAQSAFLTLFGGFAWQPRGNIFWVVFSEPPTLHVCIKRLLRCRWKTNQALHRWSHLLVHSKQLRFWICRERRS